MELTRKYNEGEIKDQEAYNEKILNLEIASLTARLALRKESGADRIQLEQQLLEKVHQQQENAKKKEEQLAKEKVQLFAEIETDAAKKARMQEDARYAEERKKYQGNTEMLELIEKKHQQNLVKIRVDAKNELFSQMQLDYDLMRKKIENDYDERIAAVEKGSSKEVSLRREKAKALADIDLGYLKAQKKILEDIIESGNIDGFELSDEQKRAFEAKLADIIKQINSVTESIKGEGIPWQHGGGASLFGVSQSDWELLFENLGTAKFRAEDLGTAFSALGGIAQEGFSLARQAIDLTASKENAALKEYQEGNDEKRK